MSRQRYRTPAQIEWRMRQFAYDVCCDFETNSYDLPEYAKLEAAALVLANQLRLQKKTALDVVRDIDRYIELLNEETENE